MADSMEPDSGEPQPVQVCNFFRKPLKGKNIRKRSTIGASQNEDEDARTESLVIYTKKKLAIADNKPHFTTGHSHREKISEPDVESKAPLFHFEFSKEIQVQNHSRATATLEIETEFSKDARAIREKALRQAEEALKGKSKTDGDEKL